jgi:hypothetical protein
MLLLVLLLMMTMVEGCTARFAAGAIYGLLLVLLLCCRAAWYLCVCAVCASLLVTGSWPAHCPLGGSVQIDANHLIRTTNPGLWFVVMVDSA